MYSLMSIVITASSLPNMNFASCLHRYVFPTPEGPRKMNEPIGRRGSFRARARATHGARDRLDRIVLVDHDQAELGFHLEQALGFGLLETRQRDAGHLRHGLGDDLTGHLANLLAIGLLGPPLVVDLFLLLLELVGLVAQLRGLLEVLRGDRLVLRAFEALDLAREVAHVGRRHHRLDAHARAGLVDHVDRLVRQEAVVDVARRELDRAARAPRRCT